MHDSTDANVTDVTRNTYRTPTTFSVNCAGIAECVECLSHKMVIKEVGKKPVCVTSHPGFSQVYLQRWSLWLATDKYKTKNKTKYRQTGSENSLSFALPNENQPSIDGLLFWHFCPALRVWQSQLSSFLVLIFKLFDSSVVRSIWVIFLHWFISKLFSQLNPVV